MFSKERTCMNWKAKIIEEILRIAIHRDEQKDSPLPEGGKSTRNHVDPCDIPALDDVLERLYHEVGAFHVGFGGFDSMGNVCVMCFEAYPKKLKTVLWLDIYDDKPFQGHRKSSPSPSPVLPGKVSSKHRPDAPPLNKGIHWTELNPVAKWKGAMEGKEASRRTKNNWHHGPPGRYHSSSSDESLIDTERPTQPEGRLRPGKH